MKKAKREKKCKVCNEIFFDYTRNNRNPYCSDKCKSEFYTITNIKPLICETCNKSFNGYKNRKYCSEECLIFSRNEGYYTRGRYIIFERDNFTCIYCGKSSYENCNKLHCEHLISIKNGGTDFAENMVTSCISCNESKNNNRIDKILEEKIIDQIKKRNLKRNIPDKLKIIITY